MKARKKRGVELSDLPPRYQRQALAQIGDTSPASNKEPDIRNQQVAKKKAERPYTPIGQRVSIKYTSYRSRLPDSDNTETKYFTDALVLAGILEDDSPKYVRKVSHEEIQSSEERTVIEIWAEGK